jgi:16S rRNA (guanine(966)-N(2))-methyltransferase RsmD
MPARPTTDFAKEGLFNVVANTWDFDGLRYLDLFAGTGSLCYEFGSRGVENITAVEKDAKMTRFIRENAEAFGLSIRVIQADVFKFLEHASGPFDIIFAGPPYPLPDLASIPDKVLAANLLSPEGELILEHNPNVDFPDHPHRFQVRRYGTTRFSFFQAAPIDPATPTPTP